MNPSDVSYFKHIILNLNLPDKIMSQICKYYLRGTCRYGFRCRFIHEEPRYNSRADFPGKYSIPFYEIQLISTLLLSKRRVVFQIIRIIITRVEAIHIIILISMVTRIENVAFQIVIIHSIILTKIITKLTQKRYIIDIRIKNIRMFPIGITIGIMLTIGKIKKSPKML